MISSSGHTSPVKKFIDSHPSSDQEFSNYVEGMLRELQPDTLVEIGPDTTLRQARLLARFVGFAGYTAVALEEDVERSVQWIDYGSKRGLGHNVLKTIHKPDTGGYTIKEDTRGGLPTWFDLLPGNATQLSELVPHADIIMLHNVLLDLTGDDTSKLWKHHRGEQIITAEEIKEMQANFPIAQQKSYAEFLKVANPGVILTFHRTQQTPELVQTLTGALGVNPRQISQVSLLYDNQEAIDENWELVIVDNNYLPPHNLDLVS